MIKLKVHGIRMKYLLIEMKTENARKTQVIWQSRKEKRLMFQARNPPSEPKELKIENVRDEVWRNQRLFQRCKLRNG